MNPAIRWARRTLFLTPFDTALTLIALPLLAWLAWGFLHWVTAVAQWVVVTDSVKVLMTGVFPVEALWRAKLAGGLLFTLFGLGLSLARPAPARAWPGATVALGASGVIAALLGGADWLLPATLAGVAAWIAASRSRFLAAHLGRAAALVFTLVLLVILPVPSSLWGGLLLSVLLTLIAGALTVPLGILLAFGRRSRVPSIRILSTGYIEAIRSVPLILVVYTIWIAVPLLWPGLNLSDVARGLAGFVLFYSAYAAEYLRSGLQAVPRGQVEAAQALGYSDRDIKRLIVLPQAMRIALPGLVGNVLDIFNFAPLVFIIGLTDFLRAGQMILANPQNSDKTMEIYVFLFVAYYLIGSAITYLARHIEGRLGRKGAK